MTPLPVSAAVSFTPWRWVTAWVAFLAIHITCMAVDWQLRNPSAPMTGGIPDILLTVIQWSSLGLLLLALFVWMPRSWAIWIRGILALLQVAVAFFLMVFGWLYYILNNGIDTL
jgi:hypothetical protein